MAGQPDDDAAAARVAVFKAAGAEGERRPARESVHEGRPQQAATDAMVAAHAARREPHVQALNDQIAKGPTFEHAQFPGRYVDSQQHSSGDLVFRIRVPRQYALEALKLIDSLGTPLSWDVQRLRMHDALRGTDSSAASG